MLASNKSKKIKINRGPPKGQPIGDWRLGGPYGPEALLILVELGTPPEECRMGLKTHQATLFFVVQFLFSASINFTLFYLNFEFILNVKIKIQFKKKI